MKKIVLLLSALLLAVGVGAQNPTSYFMEGSILRMQHNPAFAPRRGYVNIPALGGVDVNLNGNLALNNILYPRGGKLVTLLDKSVSATDALSGLSAQNLLGMDSRVNVIGFGAFTRNRQNFWAFDLNIRATEDAVLPYELFNFFKRGESAKISGIGICAATYLEAAFSYSFPLIENRLYFGVRGKFLMGAARANLRYDRFDASLGENSWKVNAEGMLDITSSGLDIATTLDEQGNRIYKPGNISLKPTKPVGYGFAIDFGATFDILPNLQVSAAVNDLGFICWDKAYNATGISVRELEFLGMIVDENGSQPQPKFDFDILKFQAAEAQSHTKMLRASVNAGIEYKVWQRKIGIGLLYTARVWEYQTLHNLTGSINFQPIYWFTVTGSYSAIRNRGHAFGLALNLSPNWINFYIATDILTAKHTPQFMPINQNNINITVGLGIPIGKSSRRQAFHTNNVN